MRQTRGPRAPSLRNCAARSPACAASRSGGRCPGRFTGPPGETSRARRCRSGPAKTNYPLNEKPMSLAVKICGLSTRETLDRALDAGADMVGFVFFPPSPRHLALDTARGLAQHVKRRAIKV